MTWREFMQTALGTWPHATWGPEASSAYVRELQARGVRPDEAVAAVRASTSQFPLSAGALAAVVERERQGPPPGWMEAYRLIADRITMLPYFEPESGMPALVDRLARDGHEAVARFAAALGAEALRNMPDPRQLQTASGSTALTRLEREYGSTVEAWREEPTPGLALAAARDGGRVRVGSGGSMADVVSTLRPVPELGSGA